jgi:hypothetical protein
VCIKKWVEQVEQVKITVVYQTVGCSTLEKNRMGQGGTGGTEIR